MMKLRIGLNLGWVVFGISKDTRIGSGSIAGGTWECRRHERLLRVANAEGEKSRSRREIASWENSIKIKVNISMNIRLPYRYCWSICAFSILLSLARRFWNQILICVSDKCKLSASSNRRPLEMYSFRLNSTSSLKVWSLLNVVLCRLCLPSFRRLRATV